MSIQHLGSMTWKEVGAFVNKNTIALLPLGSLLAHGPHLPLNTDVVIAGEMARRAGRKLSAAGKDILVCPPVVFTPADLGKGFAGTVSVSPEAFGAYLLSLLEELHSLGIMKTCLVNSHIEPGHLASLNRLVAEAPGVFGAGGMRLLFPDITKKPWVFRMPDEFKTGGAHGGAYETSCMLAIQSDKVREDIRKGLPRVDVSLGRMIREGKPTFADCGGPEAYFGDPASATALDGETYLNILAAIMVDSVLESKA